MGISIIIRHDSTCTNEQSPLYLLLYWITIVLSLHIDVVTLMFYLLYGTAIRQCLKFATCLYLHLQYHIVSSSLTASTWYDCFICRNRHHYGIWRHWFYSFLDWWWYISLFNVTWTYTGHTNDKSKTGFIHWDLSNPLYMIVGNISQHTIIFQF